MQLTFSELFRARSNLKTGFFSWIQHIFHILKMKLKTHLEVKVKYFLFSFLIDDHSHKNHMLACNLLWLRKKKRQRDICERKVAIMSSYNTPYDVHLFPEKLVHWSRAYNWWMFFLFQKESIIRHVKLHEVSQWRRLIRRNIARVENKVSDDIINENSPLKSPFLTNGFKLSDEWLKEY